MLIHTRYTIGNLSVHLATHLYICSSRPIPQAILTVTTVRKGRARMLQCRTNMLFAVRDVT